VHKELVIEGKNWKKNFYQLLGPFSPTQQREIELFCGENNTDIVVQNIEYNYINE